MYPSYPIPTASHSHTRYTTQEGIWELHTVIDGDAQKQNLTWVLIYVT